jgi:hypothetical protein
MNLRRGSDSGEFWEDSELIPTRTVHIVEVVGTLASFPLSPVSCVDCCWASCESIHKAGSRTVIPLTIASPHLWFDLAIDFKEDSLVCQ